MEDCRFSFNELMGKKGLKKNNLKKERMIKENIVRCHDKEEIAVIYTVSSLFAFLHHFPHLMSGDIK